MPTNGGFDEDVAAKRDRQSLERRQLTATAREVKRREDETRIKRQEERAGSDGVSMTSSSCRAARLGSEHSSGGDSFQGGGGGDLRSQLANVESQYERALCDNAELSSERQALMYETALLTDKLEDAEEANRELQRSFADKKRENAYLNNQLRELRHQCEFARQQLEQRDRLIAQSDCVLLQDAVGEEAAKEAKAMLSDTALLLPKELAERLLELPGDTVELKLSHALDTLASAREAEELAKREADRVRDELEKASRGRLDADQLEKQREATRQLTDYKYKLASAQQQVTGLQAEVIRLEGQVKRLTKKAEETEEECSQAKVEARNQKRSARELASELEDLRSQNNSLKRNLERLKGSGRSNQSGLDSWV